jgi:hypothetical protein
MQCPDQPTFRIQLAGIVIPGHEALRGCEWFDVTDDSTDRDIRRCPGHANTAACASHRFDIAPFGEVVNNLISSGFLKPRALPQCP